MRSDWHRGRRSKVVGGGLVLALLLGAAAFVLLPRSVPVSVVTVARGTMGVTVQEAGVARVRDLHVVSSPVTGAVTWRKLEVGDAVRKGQVMAVVSSKAPPSRAARSRREAKRWMTIVSSAERQATVRMNGAWESLRDARRHYSHQLMLHERENDANAALETAKLVALLRRRDLKVAVAGARIAREERQRLQLLLRRERGRVASNRVIKIRAPIDGTILKAAERSAQVVTAGVPLYQVGNLENLEVVTDVSSQDAVRLKPGAKVTVETGESSSAVAGQVRRVDAAAFSQRSASGREEQRVPVVVDLNSLSSAGLGHGYRVKAMIRVWEKQDVLAVPSSALFREGGGWAVYRVDGGRVSIQPVGLGEQTSDSAQVVSGLIPGAKVVVSPSDKLRSGTRVRIRST